MIFNIPVGSKIILAGHNTNIEQYQKFIDTYFLYYEFIAVADDIGAEQNLYVRGLPVVSYEKWSNYDGIIVLFHDNWSEEAEKLCDQGYLLLKDFIPAWLFTAGFRRRTISLKVLMQIAKGELEPYIRCLSYIKKIAFVYGDGNTPNMIRLLSHVKEFTEEYLILSVPGAKNITLEQYRQLETVWKYIGCLLLQPVDKNKEINYHTIQNAVQDDCKVITLPRLSFWGYFPQSYVLEHKPIIKNKEGKKYTPFLFGDKNIQKGMESDEDVTVLQSYLEDKNFYEKADVLDYLEKSLKNIQSAERDCDIKISAFIERNFRWNKLFFTPTRASFPMLFYVIDEFLRFINIGPISFGQKELKLDLDGDVPVYESLVLTLKLCFDTNAVHCCDEYYGKALSREDYVLEYYERMKTE